MAYNNTHTPYTLRWFVVVLVVVFFFSGKHFVVEFFLDEYETEECQKPKCNACECFLY